MSLLSAGERERKESWEIQREREADVGKTTTREAPLSGKLLMKASKKD